MGTRNIHLPDEMMEKVEKESKCLGISFSDYIKLLISKQFNGFNFDAMPKETPNEPRQTIAN